MYEGGGATRVAATRPEGGGDKGSDVAKGYTCNSKSALAAPAVFTARKLLSRRS